MLTGPFSHQNSIQQANDIICGILSSYIEKHKKDPQSWAKIASEELVKFTSFISANKTSDTFTIDNIKTYVIEELAPKFIGYYAWLTSSTGNSTLRSSLLDTVSIWPSYKELCKRKDIEEFIAFLDNPPPLKMFENQKKAMDSEEMFKQLQELRAFFDEFSIAEKPTKRDIAVTNQFKRERAVTSIQSGQNDARLGFSLIEDYISPEKEAKNSKKLV